jgi:hypothetical protein
MAASGPPGEPRLRPIGHVRTAYEAAGLDPPGLDPSGGSPGP